MEHVNVNFEYCRGINKLEFDFDFSENKTYVIYAPNGVMKTSFSKTLTDICTPKDTQDFIFPNRTTIRELTDEDGNDLKDDNILVIESYNEIYSPSDSTILLSNDELRNEYLELSSEIRKKYETLLKSIKKVSNYRDSTNKSMEGDIQNLFKIDPYNYEEFCALCEEKINKEIDYDYSQTRYAVLADKKTEDILKDQNVKNHIEEYINRYDELIQKSKFLRGGFTYRNASEVSKRLNSNNFFEAKHSVIFKDTENPNGDQQLNSKEDIDNLIESEKQKILGDKELVKLFNALDDKLSSFNTKTLKETLRDNRELINELDDLNELKRKLIISYMKYSEKETYDFIDTYKKNKLPLEKIIQRSNESSTKWKEIVNLYNHRFSVPFRLEIENKKDVILNQEVPKIKFIYKDSDSEKIIERDKLIEYLSQGEKRALYILNVLFKIENRKALGSDFLLVIDDIADSFDYKNKYAIVEYLHDQSKDNKIKLIVLTHNFDFYRIISSRLKTSNGRLFAEKNSSSIKLIPEKYQNNVFVTWKNYLINPTKKLSKILNKEEIFLAIIPFIRNICEYSDNIKSPDYIKLTSLLHLKDDTKDITLNELSLLISKILNINYSHSNPNDKVYDLIFKLSKEIIDKGNKNSTYSIDLEKKIILSIAIRLKAEEYMIQSLNTNNITIKEITKDQTRQLFQMMKDNNLTESIDILEEVNIMTPENIHVNSFMYEPILDMGCDNLFRLYRDVSALTA